MKHLFKIIFILMGLIVLVAILHSGMNEKLNGEKIDCYDRNNNLILDQQCIVEGGFDSRGQLILFYSFVGIFIALIFGVIGCMIDDSILRLNHYGYLP